MTAPRSALAAVVAAVSFQAADPPAPSRPAESYELDISETRIHRSGFQAGSNVVIDPGDGGIRIQVGAGVSARAIDVILRNVHGTVRFRADTSRLHHAVRSAAPTPPAATPDPRQQ
jgi:hypothetical protein